MRSPGRIPFIAVMGIVCLGSIALGVIEFSERSRPVNWGIFTEESTECEGGRVGGCTIIGRWVSEDGALVKEQILLDGGVGPGESVRASYRPGGLMGDDENNIVHTSTWSKAGLWVPWAIALFTGAAIWTRVAGSRGWPRGKRRRRE